MSYNPEQSKPGEKRISDVPYQERNSDIFCVENWGSCAVNLGYLFIIATDEGLDVVRLEFVSRLNKFM
jgi:hypothetical protein